MRCVALGTSRLVRALQDVALPQRNPLQPKLLPLAALLRPQYTLVLADVLLRQWSLVMLLLLRCCQFHKEKVYLTSTAVPGLALSPLKKIR